MTTQKSKFHFLTYRMVDMVKQQPHQSILEMIYCCRKERDFKSIFQYLWSLDENHNILNIDIKPPTKNETLSENLRKEGNILYQKKNFQQALNKYNMSIMEAPHPDIFQEAYSAEFWEEDEDHDKANYKALALGFANRSAVLYELRQYRKCIADIDCALKFGYPITLHYKLVERKARCLIALKKHQETKTLLQSTNVFLSSHKEGNTIKSFEELMYKCPTDSTVKDQHTLDEKNYDPQIKLSSLSNDELLFAYKNPPPPILKDVNPSIPAFSSALSLSYSKDRGRSVVATRDIKPGELIGVEAPFVSMLSYDDPTYLRHFCSLCTARCLTPLPCAQCNVVTFCSDSCRNEGFLKFHKVECSVLSTLIDLQRPMHGFMLFFAYRVLAQIPFAQLKSIIPTLEKETCEMPRQRQGFNEQEVYDSSDYKTIFHLEGNFSSIKLDHLIVMCCGAIVLTKLLIKSNSYFVDEHGKPFEPCCTDIILVGSTLLMHQINLMNNALVMQEFEVTLGKRDFAQNDKGGGVYSAISLFNHSCHDSAIQISYGCHQATYTTCFIPEGSEIFISYRSQFHLNSRYLRRQELLKNYNFKCNCEACINNWPLSECLEILPKLKHPKKVYMRGATDKMAKLNPRKKEEIQLYLEELMATFRSCRLGALDQKLDTNRTIAIEVLEFIGRFADMPSFLSTDAKEVLEYHVLKKQGSCNFVK